MSQIFNEIVQACPSLSSEFGTLPADERTDSRLMAELASHVVDQFEAGRIEEISAAFALAEHLIVTGPEAERHAATVGFLETVQNVASHREYGAQAFESFLGPESRKVWMEMNALWKGKASLAEVVASETGAHLRPPWWQFWRQRKRRSPQELLNEVESPELRKIIEQITRE
jgi:hypothetical protein